MRTLPGVGNSLAAAIRRVNAAYNRLPESDRPEVDNEVWRRMEHAIDDACSVGDLEAALEAISDWETFALRELEEAAK